MEPLDLRAFVRSLCPTVTLPGGAILFREGDAADGVYLIHSGAVDMLAGDRIVDTCGPNDAFGFMSVIDGAPRALTAKVRDDALLSMIDPRKFQFMVHEHPHFPFYIMRQMARRIKDIAVAV
jgi:CRP/FNR family transcriptional regulator, cyclic AMP receptor protein